MILINKDLTLLYFYKYRINYKKYLKILEFQQYFNVSQSEMGLELMIHLFN